MTWALIRGGARECSPHRFAGGLCPWLPDSPSRREGSQKPRWGEPQWGTFGASMSDYAMLIQATGLREAVSREEAP